MPPASQTTPSTRRLACDAATTPVDGRTGTVGKRSWTRSGCGGQARVTTEVCSHGMAKPEEVLARRAVDLVEALGSDLLSVAVHAAGASFPHSRVCSTDRTSWEDPRVSIGRIVSYDDARRLARSTQWREKVLVYVTRGEDLLILEHTADYPDAGIRVPAEGVDPT